MSLHGKPWSGQNKIPTINELVDRLDRDKKERDKQFDADAKHPLKIKNEDVVAHQNQERMKNAKSVSDPVTGGQVMISDVGKEYMSNATDPKVRNLYLLPLLCSN